MGELRVRAKTARVLFGHPWIFEDEIEVIGSLPESGTVKVLQPDGGFLGYALYNTNSKIRARILSRNQEDKIHLREYYQNKLQKILARKQALGMQDSMRWCFSEGDEIPGLIVDLYHCFQEQREFQTLVVQVLSLPLDKVLGEKISFFEELVQQVHAAGLLKCDWNQTVLLFKNESSSREKEGLKKEPPHVAKSLPGVDVTDVRCRISCDGSPYELAADLLNGQKTGLFLDQNLNIGLVRKWLGLFDDKHPVRILDLCCYVGHWSTSLAEKLKMMNLQAEVNLVDVSARALEFAKKNTEVFCENVQTYQHDVLNDYERFENFRDFDVVIADPPGFIKRERDRNSGASAYLRLFQKAIEMTREGGIVICCSCSGLLERDEFEKIVLKSLNRSGRRAWVLGRGGISLDHSTKMGFQQGQYLKMIGLQLQ